MPDDALYQALQALTDGGKLPFWRRSYGFAMDDLPSRLSAAMLERRRKDLPVYFAEQVASCRKVQIFDMLEGEYLAEFWHGPTGLCCIEVYLESEASLLDLMSSGRIPAFLALP